jgi:anti-anti-sigma factor
MPDPRFDVQATASGVHVVSGELDMSTAPALRTYLETVVAQTAVQTIVVDLSGVTFTDIVGLDPLLEAGSQLARDGRRLILRRARACDQPASGVGPRQRLSRGRSDGVTTPNSHAVDMLSVRADPQNV